MSLRHPYGQAPDQSRLELLYLAKDAQTYPEWRACAWRVV